MSVSCLREKKAFTYTELSWLCYIVVRLVLPPRFFFLYLCSLIFTFRKKKEETMKLFFSLFGFCEVFLACNLYPCYLPFFAIFTQNILRYNWFGNFFFFEDSSCFKFSVTHESIPLFFWLMKVEFEISMGNWQIFRHYGKTKNNFEISDVLGAPKWWLQGAERIIRRRHILRKGCFKILYQNYFHTLNHKKISEQFPLTVTYYLFSISQLYMWEKKF